MIVETLLLGLSLVGCAGCWAAVQKHRITAEMQKNKLKHDLEVLKPNPAQQSLTALLERRENLEEHINELRKRVSDYTEARFAQYRADSLKALEDARQEQQELVLEQTGLLEMMMTTEAFVKKKKEEEEEEVVLTPPTRVGFEDDLERQFSDLEEAESREGKEAVK